ncbi:MAG: SDR family NAD(P)-dependent oxidoreductase [Beijerinckiaceae bacterium]|nr:SDR family NAD(P)-dependent oxidoreductase [Beijerinckiaceae bacterium]MCZ8299210.1 SDR family NAD(P)-dependent oxidoreductase [Beijerinckiaceae bacterium]
MDIAGKAVIVTGGGSGLGAATAEFLATRGARVGIIDLDAQAAERMAVKTGGIALPGDVASEEAMVAALARARAAHGPCRVLVNCAGIGTARRVVGRDGPMPLAEFERVIRVNLIGSFNMLRLAGAGMTTLDPLADGERGVIISTASVAAFEGQVGQAAYSASKGGIAAMTLPVAREFASFGIRVLTIAPGLFLTPMMRTLPEEVQKSLGESIPFPRRLGGAEEYASLVGHMIENRFLNGEIVRLDGALRLPPR